MTRKEFSNTLVKCREQANCGKNELCRRTGFTFNQLQRLERSENNFSIDNVLIYLKAIEFGIYISKNNNTFLFDSKEAFSKNFKIYRKEAKMSLRAFSDFAGVSLSVVRGIEDASKNTTIDSILLCIEKLNCKLEINKI